LTGEPRRDAARESSDACPALRVRDAAAMDDTIQIEVDILFRGERK
jgi:hypothetical protein